MDDVILVVGNSMEEFICIKTIFYSNFKIKDLGTLKYFLGIEVAHSVSWITLCQKKYCLDLLHETSLLGS